MRLFVLMLFALFSGFCLQAQESARYLKFKNKYNYSRGYIIAIDSSKVEGLVKSRFGSGSARYSSVIFMSKEGKKSRYYPHEIWEYGDRVNSYASDGGSFYERVQSGPKVELYKRLSTNSWSSPGGPGMPSNHYSTESEDFYVRKMNERRFRLVKKRRFEETFAEYFGDCDAVKNSILKKEFTHKDIRKIVLHYNNCH
jgi:hypothetical protein